MPSIYLGINIPFFALFLLPAHSIFSFFVVLSFLSLVSIVSYRGFEKQLISKQSLMLDESESLVGPENAPPFGVISAFSIVTTWFVYLKFENQSYRSNKLILLNSLNKKDKKRLLRAVYQRRG